MKRLLLATILAVLAGTPSGPDYSIRAICYASSPGVPVAELVVGGPEDEKVDIALVVWLIRGGGPTILFDSGFHRNTFLNCPLTHQALLDWRLTKLGVFPRMSALPPPA